MLKIEDKDTSKKHHKHRVLNGDGHNSFASYTSRDSESPLLISAEALKANNHKKADECEDDSKKAINSDESKINKDKP